MELRLLNADDRKYASSYDMAVRSGYMGSFERYREELQARLTLKHDALPLLEELFELACHGDYSNGNEAQGFDEGRVHASQYLDELGKRIEQLRTEAGK